jgi:hypothetical protein
VRLPFRHTGWIGHLQLRKALRSTQATDSRSTAWHWRKKGWLKTINMPGRQYLTQQAIDEFHRRRASAGEFSAKILSHKEARVGA